jgi:hypothetical protein
MLSEIGERAKLKFYAAVNVMFSSISQARSEGVFKIS